MNYKGIMPPAHLCETLLKNIAVLNNKAVSLSEGGVLNKESTQIFEEACNIFEGVTVTDCSCDDCRGTDTELNHLKEEDKCMTYNSLERIKANPVIEEAEFKLSNACLKERSDNKGLEIFTRNIYFPLGKSGESKHTIQLLAAILNYNVGISHMLLLSKDSSDNFTKVEEHFIRVQSILSMHFRDCSIKKSMPLSYQQALDYIGFALHHSRGLLCHRSNEHAKASNCFNKARAISIENYGERHPLAAHSIYCIAITLQILKESRSSSVATVSKKDHNIIPIHHAIFQEETPSILIKISLSILLNSLQQQDNALVLCTRPQIKTAIAAVRNSIGDALFVQSKFEEAYSFLNDAYRIRSEILGTNNPDTAISALKAGKCLHHLHRSEDAIPYYEVFTAVVTSDMKNLGSALKEKAILEIQSIAWAFYCGKSYSNSEKFYTIAFAMAEKVLGENHQVVARILNQMGNLEFELGDLAFALQYYERGLKIETNLCLMRSSRQAYIDHLTTMSNILSAHERIGNAEEALLHSTRMLSILRSFDCSSTLPKSVINMMATNVLVRMASIQRKKGMYDQALHSLDDALQIQKLEYGDHHICIAFTLNSIGIIHGIQGHNVLALESFEESLRVRKIQKNSDRIGISTALFNIAHMHLQSGQSTRAISDLEEIVNYELSRKNISNSKSSTEAILTALEQIVHVQRNELGNPTEALKYLRRSIDIIKESDPDVVPRGAYSRFLGLIGNTCLELHDLVGAMNYFAETMRINIAHGLAFNANISHLRPVRKRVYYFFTRFETDHLPGAPAA
jgi:tetratricopeptide (TPR) repeat protein